MNRRRIRKIYAATMAGLIAALLALAGCGGSSPSTTPTPPVATSPAPPVATATAGNGQNTISWANVTGSTSYKIYFAANSAASSAAEIKAANNVVPGSIISPYTHAGLTNGTLYSYVVTAISAAGESNPSGVISATPDAAAPAAPTVTSYNPAQGAVGTTVTISGSNFSTTPANNEVTFNGTPATVSAATATSLTVTIPSGATTGPISVSTNGQGASSYPASSTFTVTAPIISAFVSKPYPVGVGAPPYNAQASGSVGAIIMDNTNTSVAINGNSLSYAAGTNFTGNIPNTSGQQMSLSVTYGGTTYTATGNQFTTDLFITAPANGGTVIAAATTAVTWTAPVPTPSDPYTVQVMDVTNNGTQIYSGTTSGTSLNIPAGTMTAGNNYMIVLLASTSIPIANAATGSAFTIGTWYYVTVTAQ